MKSQKRLGTNRPALERMHRIHQLLANREYPNCRKLAGEFEVVKRTVKRDVEFMRDRLELPIEFDWRRNGYYYTKPVERFPDVPMSEAEVFALFVANKAIEQYQGTPFQKLLETAFRRLTGCLDESVKFSLGSLDEVLSFRPFAPGDADVRAFELLSAGIRKRQGVSFVYRNHGSLTTKQRRVHPYHLAHAKGGWYLFAHDLGRQKIRTFALWRINGEPKLLASRFQVAEKFDLKQYLRGSFAVYHGKDGDDYEVVVDLDAWGADEVRGRRWHASQQLTELPKGMLRVSLRLNNLEEVENWVMSLGVHATVVRPMALRERLRKAATELAKRYREDQA